MNKTTRANHDTNEPPEKWWSEKPVSLRLGAVHGLAGDIAEEAWIESRRQARRQAIEACAVEVEREGCWCKYLSGPMVEVPVGMEYHDGRMMHRSDGHYQACPKALAARLRNLI